MDEQNARRGPSLALVAVVAIGAYLMVRYGENWLRHLLLYLSQAGWARTMVTDQELAWRVASRFVAGTDRQAAATVAQGLNNQGLKVTMDYLGESVTDQEGAISARDEILRLINTIHEHQLDSGISIKLSQLGLKIDENLAKENACQIVQHAAQRDLFVRIDMEDSLVTGTTLHI
ncbi:MAG: proline dehydrogenase family protein [Chloroflexota bacterium]